MRGRKPLLIFLIVPLLFLFYSCGGGGSGSSFSPPADTTGLPFSLTLLPSQSVAQTNSSIILNAKVLDGNGAPVPNVVVTFTNLSEPFGVLRAALRALGLVKPIGELSAAVATTNSLGIAKVSIFSSTVGFATVQAEISNSVGISRTKKTLLFALNLEPGSPTLRLHADDGDGTFDEPADFILLKGANDNQRTIRADVLDAFGSFAFGATVTFGTDLPFRANGDPATTCSDGTNTCSVVFPNGNTSQTNQLGQAFTLLQVNPTSISNLGTVLNVTAQTTIGNQTAANLLSLFLSPVNVVGPPKSFLTALPSTVGTTQTSKVTAVVFLNTGSPAPDGTSVNFTVAPKTVSDPSPCGTIDPFQQTTSGATSPATFTPPLTPGICTVTGTVGGVTIGTADITVTTALTVQPNSQTVDGVNGATGASAPKFLISGGIAPYTVTSSNTLFPPSAVSASGEFSVNVPTGSQPVNVTYTVKDTAGTTVQATLVITGIGTFSVTPTTFDIDSSAGGTIDVQYFVSGGKGPYKVFFGLTNFIGGTAPTFTQNGNTVPGDSGTEVGPNQATFTVRYTVAAGDKAKFQVIVVDTVGAFKTSDVNITGTAPALSVTPATQTVNCNSLTGVSFLVSGGTPTYTITSLNTAILTVTPTATGFDAIPTAGACAAIGAAPATLDVTVAVQDSATPTPALKTVTVTVNGI